MAEQVVLVVDDEPLSRKLLRVNFEARGYRVVEAVSVATAMEAFNLHSPAIVLLDMVLTNNGIEICRSIRKISDVPIVFVSAVTSESKQQDALSAGAQLFITKPFGADHVVKTVEAILEGYRQEARIRKGPWNAA